MATSAESISKDFAPSAIGRWATDLHASTEQSIGQASDRLIEVFSEKAAELSDGDREKLLGYVEGLKETLDADKRDLLEVIDDVTGSFKAARQMIKETGGVYRIDFAEEFNKVRAKTDGECGGLIKGHVVRLEKFVQDAEKVSDVKTIQRLMNEVGDAIRVTAAKARKLSDNANAVARELLENYQRDAEGFGPKSK